MHQIVILWCFDQRDYHTGEEGAQDRLDVERQALNVARMRLLGARVLPVESGSRTLKDAVNEAMRHWVANVTDTHFCVKDWPITIAGVRSASN